MFWKWEDSGYTEGQSNGLLLWSPGTELSESVEFYSEDCLEMTGHSAMALRRHSLQLLLIYIMVLKYMSLCAL